MEVIRTRPGLSVIIPVYNSEKILPSLAERLVESLDILEINYEVIFVVDGSPDNSWQQVLTLQKQYGWLRGIFITKLWAA